MKKKNRTQDFVSIFGSFPNDYQCNLWNLADYSATAQAATRDEAVAWANAQIGKGLDYDGAYGNQCVDLIKYYYDYFGVAGYAKGNANAYITNALPPDGPEYTEIISREISPFGR